MTFTDVTAKAGVGGGNDPLSIVADALWFDYDNDGWRDLLVVRFGTPILYHNEHNGTFKDVTAQSGPDQVRQHDRRDRVRLRQRRPARPDVRQLFQAAEPARRQEHRQGSARAAERSRQRRQRRRRHAVAQRSATASSRTSPRRPASASTPAGRSTSATATSTTTACRTSISRATTAPTASSSTTATAPSAT